jgi:hypothetical protein
VQKLMLHLTDNVKNGIKSLRKVSVDQFSQNMYISTNNPQGGGADVSSFSAMKNINQCLVNFQ